MMTGKEFKKVFGADGLYLDTENEQFYIPFKVAIPMPVFYRAALKAIEDKEFDFDLLPSMFAAIETWADDDPAIWELLADEFNRCCVTEDV